MCTLTHKSGSFPLGALQKLGHSLKGRWGLTQGYIQKYSLTKGQGAWGLTQPWEVSLGSVLIQRQSLQLQTQCSEDQLQPALPQGSVYTPLESELWSFSLAGGKCTAKTG